MPSPRRRLPALTSALVLAIGAAVGTPGTAVAAPADPFDDLRERVLATPAAPSAVPSAGSRSDATSGLATRSTGSTTRRGHVVDGIDDVRTFDVEGVDPMPPAHHARTIDINRFGYHFGRQAAKFTIRTRDLRAVKGADSSFMVSVLTRSTGGAERFTVYTRGTRSIVETEGGWARPCPERSVARDAARNTITIRVPLRCLSGKATPTSMQPVAYSMLMSEDHFGYDITTMPRRADVRS